MNKLHIDKLIEDVRNETNLDNWKKFPLDFSKNLDYKSEIVDSIKSSINDKKITPGIYLIYDGEKCLYVGKSKDIWKRIKSHYYAAHKEDRSKRWSDFFSQYKKDLTVYWKEYTFYENSPLNNKIIEVIETVLQDELKPLFEYKDL
jgi:predicted GIY-YIG superfamily endonuclease